MKVCFPVNETENYLEVIPYDHFGSASNFVIYDTDNDETKIIENCNLHHSHGACNPSIALNGESVDAVVVGSLGARALMKLNAMGIKVYKASKVDSIKKHIKLIKNEELHEILEKDTCAGQHRHHGCH